MSDPDPNDKQQDLIDARDGVYLVNAGPGTGKTFTIKHRYADLLEDGVDPEDILLITYTRTGADTLREQILTTCDANQSRLRDAPIDTFHAHAYTLLQEYGFNTARAIGIPHGIDRHTDLIEDEALERQRFAEFLAGFQDRHPEHHPLLQVENDPGTLLSLIQSLAVKGIIPDETGWYRGSRDLLEGDRDAFRQAFDDVNQQDGNKQSPLRKQLNKIYRIKAFPPDIPAKQEIRGGGKTVPDAVADRAFDEDREAMFDFVHDLYHEYLAYALEQNYLNFQFVLVLAYILLMEHDRLREHLAYNHVMLDEFQDTNELQFKLALLLSATGNIAVVGDWKQSIFSFQYTTVENIQEFENRIQAYYDALNSDRNRLSYDLTIHDPINLKTNYRSTQDIIDASREALLISGRTRGDDQELDRPHIRDEYVHLDADNTGDTQVEQVSAADEHAYILATIQELVDNPDYTIPDDNDTRRLTYDDIAVLSRKRRFCRELQQTADEYDIPVAFEGGIDIFSERPGIILLAWLRIIEELREDRGWAVILDDTGYTYPEIKQRLEDRDWPDDFQAFRDTLQNLDTIPAIARRIFDRYGWNSPVTDQIIDTLASAAARAHMTRRDLIRWIEGNIEDGSTFDVDTTTTENTVTTQTLHSAKGLEYPVVFVANLNSHQFPSYDRGDNTLFYHAESGLRQKKVWDSETSYAYDNWRTAVIGKILSGTKYNEERRLLYVGMTRAENYLYLTAEQERESPFFTNLPLDTTETDIDEPPHGTPTPTDRPRIEVTPPSHPAPIKRGVTSITPETVETAAGRGTEFGDALHNFAEQYAHGMDVPPSNQDEEHVQTFINRQDGTLTPETECLLPLDVNGRTVVLNGQIDLLVEDADTVTVVDYKTVEHGASHQAYRTQVSAYHHAVADAYPDKAVTTILFYTPDNEAVTVNTLSRDKLARIAADSIETL